jgi:hypothetical protein
MPTTETPSRYCDLSVRALLWLFKLEIDLRCLREIFEEEGRVVGGVRFRHYERQVGFRRVH